MDLRELKRLVVIAMFSDDVLMRQLVLKGGNALELVHGLVARGSVDIDFSIADDSDWKRRATRALSDRFDSAGYVVFDVSFEDKPPLVTPDRQGWWGGYLIEFKLISKQRHKELRELASLRRQAEVVGPEQRRTFKIDISKHEFCDGKVEAELDDYTVYVYTPEMNAIEKVRAICQQMPAYAATGNKRPRARDFYRQDPRERHCTQFSLAKSPELFRAIFDAKRVPLALIGEISTQREFHRTDWPSIQATVRDAHVDFDTYFDRLLAALAPLQTLWKE